MATVPLSGTNIRLLSGVPFSNDYKHTRWFDTIADQTNYFFARTVVHSMANANFQRAEGNTFISVDKSIDELRGVNYLMFQNAEYNSKWFYGFVTRLEYVQKKSTRVHFQLDAFQTWRFDFQFKPSYVIREHCKLWNADGSPVINTVDEGLYYGSNLETVKVDNFVPHGEIFYLVIVAKQTMHGGSADTPEIKPMLNGSPQPLTYYIHPFKLDGTSPIVRIDDSPPVNISSFTEVLKSMYKQTDAVNNIVSMYITEYIGHGGGYNSSDQSLSTQSMFLEHVTIQGADASINTLYLKKKASYDVFAKNMGNKYTGYDTVTESKLLMYPYTVLILDDFKGNRIELKNEYIKDSDLVLNVLGSMGTSNKIAYSVAKYLRDGNEGFDVPISLEYSLINNNPNDVPIITDLLSAYIQGNRNTLENQKDTIMFNGVMNAVGSLTSGVGSAMQRNPVGVVGSAVESVQGLGNTALQLAGMQAKQMDLDNTPPSIAKMGSNTAFDFGNGLKGIYVIKKQITAEYRKKLSDYFKMFGYKVNEVKTPNFHTRQSFNFVQTSSCNITGNINNDDLNDIKNIFDNGITLWHTNDVGNYSLENEVI